MKKAQKTIKQRKCRVCGNKFLLPNSLAFACSFDCVIKYGKENNKQERVQRAIFKIAKEKIKTRSEHLSDVQKAFNAFIREQDKNEPCISCSKHHQGQYHAGHYRSVGACPYVSVS